MELIPAEEIRKSNMMNLTPMVDFLFLVVAVFAILAVTRSTLFDSEVHLAKVQTEPNVSSTSQAIHVVNLSVTEQGQYRWITEFNEYAMHDVQAILQELSKQQKLGLLPTEKEKTKILLHVDKKAEWDPVIQLIYALKKTGFAIHPVYESA